MDHPFTPFLPVDHPRRLTSLSMDHHPSTLHAPPHSFPPSLHGQQHIPYHVELQDAVKPFFYHAVQKQHEQRSSPSLRGGGRPM